MCPKPQKVQSVECLNVTKDTCSSHDREDGSRCAAPWVVLIMTTKDALFVRKIVNLLSDNANIVV
jgi:hypothetical protein